MPYLDRWQMQSTRAGDGPRVSFGGQGDWLPASEDDKGTGSVEMKNRVGAWISRGESSVRGFSSGRMRAHLYIGPDGAASVTAAAQLELKCYVQTEIGVTSSGDDPYKQGEGGFIALISQYSDRYRIQIVGEDITRNRQGITEEEETALGSPLTSGDFIGWELRWNSSADPAIDPNPNVSLILSYFLTDDWATPIPVQHACCDYSTAIWENFYSPIVWGIFTAEGRFLKFTTNLWYGAGGIPEGLHL